MLQTGDLLNNEDLLKLFGKEKVLVSCEVKKYNDYGFR